MVDFSIVKQLMNCFRGSFINHNGEFIAERKCNIWFCIETCADELEVKCKVLEWLSRPAYKTEPYATKKSNDKLHAFISAGVNGFLGTEFTHDDFRRIYSALGNNVNREKTIRFIQSGYDMTVLEDERDEAAYNG